MKKFFIFGVLGVLSVIIPIAILAGTNNLATETGPIIQLSHVNKFKTALSGDLVPRDSSGNVVTLAASVGTTVYKFLKVFAESGYWSAGDIKAHHSYNGLVGAGEGWMLCDGRVISEANYNTEHGSGHWATYVGSSPLDGKYLPDCTDKYLVGAATTTQAGTIAITTVGNTNHSITVEHSSHTHTVPDHTHKWLSNTDNVGVAGNQSYASNGTSFLTFSDDTSTVNTGFIVDLSGGTNQTVDIDYYTSLKTGVVSGSTAPSNTTEDIQPESIEIQYYVRIVE